MTTWFYYVIMVLLLKAELNIYFKGGEEEVKVKRPKELKSRTEILDRLEVDLEKRDEGILELCHSGIEEVDKFTEAMPEYFFPGLEQIKEDFYSIIKYLK